MKLYDYIRSTAAYRVRIALNLKGLDYQSIPVSLLEDEQNDDSYKSVNASGLVATLVIDHHVLAQSLAIIEYLDDAFPESPVLPSSPLEKALCRSIALDIACDIHPLNNLRVLKYLTNDLAHSESEKMNWYFHWLTKGFDALEGKLSTVRTPFCCGEQPTLADICLVPQLFNARRFNFDLSPYPTLVRIEANCLSLAAFSNASPSNG